MIFLHHSLPLPHHKSLRPHQLDETQRNTVIMTTGVGNEKHTSAATNFQQLCCAFSPGGGVIELRLEMEKVSEVKEQSQAHGTCLSVIFPAPFQSGHGVYVCVCACTHTHACLCLCTHTQPKAQTQPCIWVFMMEAQLSPMLLLSNNFSNCFDLLWPIPSSSVSLFLPPPCL